MAKFNIQINIPIEMNTDDLKIDRKTLEDYLQWAIQEDAEYRPPFHIEMLQRGFHETLKMAVRHAVEEKESHKYDGKCVDTEHEDSGTVVTSHTPMWALTAPVIYNRFRIENMEVWRLKLQEVKDE
jgi:hypothetical protein